MMVHEDIIESEIEKFVIIDDRNPNRGYILRENLFRLIHSLANELISKFLNYLVDKEELVLCWDQKRRNND